jgi:glycopeptide antibiotics resistance protein
VTRLRDPALVGTLVYLLLLVVLLVAPLSKPHLHRGYLMEFRLPIGRRFIADVAVNLVIFAPLGWGLHRNARRFHRLGPSGRLIAAIGSAAAFSLVMETVQWWLPGRYSSIVDVAVNTAGAALGALIEAGLGERLR